MTLTDRSLTENPRMRQHLNDSPGIIWMINNLQSPIESACQRFVEEAKEYAGRNLEFSLNYGPENGEFKIVLEIKDLDFPERGKVFRQSNVINLKDTELLAWCDFLRLFLCEGLPAQFGVEYKRPIIRF